MFEIVSIYTPKRKFNVRKPKKVDFSHFQLVIDGAEVYDTLCPVSSVTGCRENPLSLLKSLINDPAKSRLLDSVLGELPSMASNPNVSYDDMISTLQSVFDKGTFYEDDSFAERLMSISEDLLKTVGIDKPITEVSKESPSSEPASSSE